MTTLDSICTYVTNKVPVVDRNQAYYVSTESMIANRGGIFRASVAPRNGKATAFSAGDTLISNIRPYFKKIWHATHEGICSNDVLVFRPRNGCDSDYLYWLLSGDDFFDYVMATSKGTKMPRGDKSAIMSYGIPDYNQDVQRKIAHVLNPIQRKIICNSRANGYLAA